MGEPIFSPSIVEPRGMDEKKSWYKQQLIQQMMEESSLGMEEVQAMADATRICAFEAGSTLLRAGEIMTCCYYNLKGCVRQYYLVDGEEKTTFFYTEGMGIASFSSATQKEPAPHYLSCVEDSILAVVSVEKENELYNKYPNLESACRNGLEEEIGQYQEMLAHYITSTPEERYLDLLENRPELIHRVPQYQLATYLGIKPESLSRIRKRLSVKQ